MARPPPPRRRPRGGGSRGAERGGLPPRSSSPVDGLYYRLARGFFEPARARPRRGARGGRARGVDIRARFATSDFRRRGRKRRFSSAEKPQPLLRGVPSPTRASSGMRLRERACEVAAPYFFAGGSRRRGAQSLDRGSRAGDGGDSEREVESGARVTAFRSRVSSFHNLLQDISRRALVAEAAPPRNGSAPRSRRGHQIRSRRRGDLPTSPGSGSIARFSSTSCFTAHSGACWAS